MTVPGKEGQQEEGDAAAVALDESGGRSGEEEEKEEEEDRGSHRVLAVSFSDDKDDVIGAGAGGGSTNDDEEEERDRLLDRFPLCGEDLDRLLVLFGEYSSSKAATSESGEGGRSENGDEDAELLASILFRRRHHPDAKAAQALSRIFRRSVETVFVIPTSSSADAEDLQRDRFLEAAVSLLGRRGQRYLVDALFDEAAASKSNSNSEASGGATGGAGASTRELMDLVYLLACSCLTAGDGDEEGREENGDDAAVRGVVSDDGDDDLDGGGGWTGAMSLDDAAGTVSRQQWNEWLLKRGSPLHCSLAVAFARLIGISRNEYMDKCHFRIPKIPSSSFSTRELLALAAMGLGNGGNISSSTWHSIYSSDEDGLSFATFQEALMGYTGPTLILIRTTNGEALGYCTCVPWKDSRQWYTASDGVYHDVIESDSFLFRLSPSWNVYPLKSLMTPSSKHKFHQYLHTPFESSKMRQVQPLLHGLAVGGVDQDSPRLHLKESLERCVAGSFDLVFEQGPLLADPEEMMFDVDLLQVWAVKTDEEGFRRYLKNGKLHAAVRETTRQHIAKVDKRQFLEDFQSGAYLNNMYTHREQTRGRADFVALDNQRQGYYLEGKRPSVARLQVDKEDLDES